MIWILPLVVAAGIIIGKSVSLAAHFIPHEAQGFYSLIGIVGVILGLIYFARNCFIIMKHWRTLYSLLLAHIKLFLHHKHILKS